MASWNRTMLRRMERDGFVIRNGKWVKVKRSNAETRKERHDFLLKQKEVPHNLYSESGEFAESLKADL